MTLFQSEAGLLYTVTHSVDFEPKEFKNHRLHMAGANSSRDRARNLQVGFNTDVQSSLTYNKHMHPVSSNTWMGVGVKTCQGS